jgi:hypothetical protein
MFVPEYGYTVTEHDDKPWLVLGSEQRAITLEEGTEFLSWAHREWPGPRWSVQLDPFQLTPEWR